MVEHRLEEQSPQELNSELRKLYESLPGPLDFRGTEDQELLSDEQERLDRSGITPTDLFGEVSNSELRNFSAVVRSADSETRKVILDRVKKLLGLSHLIPSTHELVIDSFRHLTVLGVDKTDLRDQSTYKQLRLGSDRGGIFDPEEAKAINGRLIREQFSIEFVTLRVAKHMANAYPEDWSFSTERDESDSTAWKALNEYKEKYGEEPETL